MTAATDTYDRTIMRYLDTPRQSRLWYWLAVTRRVIPPFDPLVHSTPARTAQRTFKIRQRDGLA